MRRHSSTRRTAPLARDVARALPGVTAKAVAPVLAQVGGQFDDLAMVAAAESERRTELAALAPMLLSVPWLEGDIHDLAGLAALADHLRDRTAAD